VAGVLVEEALETGPSRAEVVDDVENRATISAGVEFSSSA
jgi:hypothetical protein